MLPTDGEDRVAKLNAVDVGVDSDDVDGLGGASSSLLVPLPCTSRCESVCREIAMVVGKENLVSIIRQVNRLLTDL
jgi:hypothetical protein